MANEILSVGEGDVGENEGEIEGEDSGVLMGEGVKQARVGEGRRPRIGLGT